MTVSLTGQAQGVLETFPLELRQDYKELVKSLELSWGIEDKGPLKRGKDVQRLFNRPKRSSRETLAKDDLLSIQWPFPS
jgi:hypothetical protein